MSGIDWGRGMSNIDHETGIRYAVISANLIDMEDFEYYYPVVCPECYEILEDMPEDDDLTCPVCGESQTHEDYFCQDEPSDIYYNQNGYELSYEPNTNDIIITKSPYKTKAGFCSMCFPGGVYLTDRSPDAWGYCLPEEFFGYGVKIPYEYEEVVKK